MAPTIPSAKLTLSCPLFAADFDPRNSDYLLVGGGGGEGRSGVGNRIALLNTSEHNQVTETTEIQLSRDEDSVTSIAVAHTSEDSIITLAGINSSMAEQKRDNNQHLRSFKIDLPKEKGEEGKETPTSSLSAESSLLSRASLFRPTGSKGGSDTYQRVVRLSPWKGDEAPRVAAITTGLAPCGEVVFFQAISRPTEADVIGRIRLGDREEAEDVDIIGNGDGGKKFQAAYTNGVDVFACQISSGTRGNTSPEVSCVYTTPLPGDGKKSKSRPKFRALRFLSATSLLLLQNAPDRNGCELVVLNLPLPEEKKPATIVRRKKLRKTVKIGLGLDVCTLGVGGENQQQQTIIAVTGSDQSIEILTLEYDPRKGYGKIQPYTSLRDVHPFSMTKICFSTFTPPAQSPSQPGTLQYVKLASVSMGNTVVVHSLPLTPFRETSQTTPRYVLAVPKSGTSLFSFTAVLTILVIAILLQGLFEIRGSAPSYLGAADWVPPHLRDVVAPAGEHIDPLVSSPSISASATTTTTVSVIPNPSRQPLRDILRAQQVIDPETDSESPPPSNVIIVRCTTAADDGDAATEDIVIETVPSGQEQEPNSNLHPWEALGEEQKTIWKQRLANAGRWAVEEGETVLMGVLFTEYGGIVRGVAGEELP